MYAPTQNGQAAQTARPTQSNAYYLGTLRRNILAAVVDNDLFTAEEQLKTNHSVYECQCAARLARWVKNVRRVAGEREKAASLAKFAEAVERGKQLQEKSVGYATMAQCDEIHRVACHSAILPCEKSQAIFRLPTLTYAQAIFLLGRLYAKVYHRTGQQLGNDGSTQLATR